MAVIQSFGAAEVVTGSCHLLQIEKGPNIMVDCGMFQGVVENRNFEPFGFDPREVDILLVTHAHLDHVGRIPKLVKEGFNGRIVTLRSTMKLQGSGDNNNKNLPMILTSLSPFLPRPHEITLRLPKLSYN